MSEDDRRPETSVPDLWEAARHLLRWLYAMCGGPRALAGEARLSRRERRRIVFWLRPLEALVRRLLVAEAARLAPTLRPARQDRRKPAGRSRRPNPKVPFPRNAFLNPDDPAAWKVSFSPLPRPAAPPSPAAGMPERLVPRVRNWDTPADVLAPARLALDAERFQLRHREQFIRSACPPDPAPSEPSRGPGSPWPLALRLEALTRVVENPAPWARRLARRLNRDASRVAGSLSPPPVRPPGTRLRFGEESLRFAHDRAVSALAPFDTS